MRYLAIGDVHGYSEVLAALLEMVKLGPDDQIITLGDYVDRGPDSRGVIEQLLALEETGQLVALRGNHDMMMLAARAQVEEGQPPAEHWSGGDALREWLMCGGRPTLMSYGWDDGKRLPEVPASHWHFLEETCVDWYEIDTHFFVHANVYPEQPLEEQPLSMLHWEALYEAQPHCSGKVMVCGHTKQRSGWPRNWGHTVCIDTWVYGDGWLTCLDVASGRLWQANRRGEQRTGWLDEPEE
jgi:serine/threonine protein phosphatase 1